jgi:hypothetical protein
MKYYELSILLFNADFDQANPCCRKSDVKYSLSMISWPKRDFN